MSFSSSSVTVWLFSREAWLKVRASVAHGAEFTENVEYLPDRGLKQEELMRFGTCNYIQEHHNIILLGATGSGKTYLACAHWAWPPQGGSMR